MQPRQTSHAARVRLTFLASLLTLSLAAVLNCVDFRSSAQGQVQVTAADPAATEQGTVSLNVRVTGKGFKNGARAKWFVTGTTNPGGVTVNSTTFVSSTELTANITVDDAAIVANFDIQVTNSDGRGGKGTELFAVTPKGQTSCGMDVTNLSISIYKYTDATNTTTYNMWPDQTNANGSPVPYVSGKIRSDQIDGRLQIGNCTYDLTLNLNLSKRYFIWKFPNGTSNNTFFNIDRVGDVPITDGGASFLNWCNTAMDNYGGCGVDGTGYFVRRAMGSGTDFGRHRYNYSPIDNVFQTAAGTAYVKIYHSDSVTWTIIPDVTSPPPGVTGTDGEWSVLLDTNTGAVLSYQKMPFKMVVKRF